MKDEDVAALEPGLYELTWKGGQGRTLAAVGPLGSGRRWFAPVRESCPLSPRGVAWDNWDTVESARRLDRDYAQARAAVRQVLYTHLSDPELDRACENNIVDDLIKAVGVTMAARQTYTVCNEPRCPALEHPEDLHSHPDEPRGGRVCNSLFDFMESCAPVLGLAMPLSPYLKIICEIADRAARAEIARRETGPYPILRGSAAVRGGAAIAESFPDLADVITGHRAQTAIVDDPAVVANRVVQACDDAMDDARAVAAAARRDPAPPVRNVVEALDRLHDAAEGVFPRGSAFVDARSHDAGVAALGELQRAALAYADAKLAEAGEAHTDAARLLIARLSEEL